MPPVFIVHLRQPEKRSDYREDPYWETGSFGCTGCHAHNLMSAKHRHLPDGARLAFVQGGDDGSRLVFVTPPITVHPRGEHVEARWKPTTMPFRYDRAPLLLDAGGASDFRNFRQHVLNGNGASPTHKVSSRYRSRVHPLPAPLAAEIVNGFEQRYSAALPTDIAQRYYDAVPLPCAWPLLQAAGWVDPNDRINSYRKYYGMNSRGSHCTRAPSKGRCR